MTNNKCVRALGDFARHNESRPKRSKVKGQICKTAIDQVRIGKDKATFKQHQCNIVQLDRKRRLIKLKTCGWESQSTKRRLNDVLNNLRVDKKIKTVKGKLKIGSKDFREGMIIKY